MIETFEGTFLTKDTNVSGTLPFTKVANVALFTQFEGSEKRAYVVPSLSADFLLLFTTASCIITMSGSPLSHLAILAREYGLPLFLANGLDFEGLSDSGVCTLATKKVSS